MEPPRKKRRRSRRSNSNSSAKPKSKSSMFKDMTDDIKIDAPELNGKYKIIGKIDHGGYAIVYKAINLNKKKDDDQYVAIKRVHSANVQDDYSNNACIEIQILRDMVNEPYFPTIKEVLVDMKSCSYSIIMNYFEHQPFEEYITKLTQKQTIRYIYILLLCINKLSNKGYVHRDIKPGNVLYNYYTNKQLVIDFGLCQSIASIKTEYDKQVSLFRKHKNKISAKRRHSMIPLSKHKNENKNENKRKHHRRSNILNPGCLPMCIRDGTPGFRAPEIILKSNYQDSKIDVYNIGLILACIMLGVSTIFSPKNDYQQLQQMITWYGIDTIQRTAYSLERNLQINNIKQEDILMNNGPNDFNDNRVIFGHEVKTKTHSGLGYWVKTRLKMNITNKYWKPRNWTDSMFDLLDKLTACDPHKRLSPKEALKHPIFKDLQIT